MVACYCNWEVEIIINLIKTPQRADIVATYEVNGDVLIVMIEGLVEMFDFAGFPNGQAKEIIVDILPINPIISASKANGVLNITVIKFYSEEEKPLYEVGVGNV